MVKTKARYLIATTGNHTQAPEGKHTCETKMLSSLSLLFYIFPIVPRKFALLINLYNWLKNICI